MTNAIVNNFENDNLLQAIVVGYDFISSKSAIELAQKYGTKYLHDELRKIDTEAADKIDMNNVFIGTIRKCTKYG